MNPASLTFRPLDASAVIALVVLAGAVVFYAWRMSRFAWPAKRKAALLILRAAALCLVLVAFLQPAVERGVRLKQVPAALVMDSSESMSVMDAGTGGNQRRWDAALAKWQERRSYLEKHFDVSYHTVDQSMAAASTEDLPSRRPKGSASALGLVNQLPKANPALRAIFLFSDGRTGGGAPPKATEGGVPVFTVGVGKWTAAPDLIVEDVRAPHFAYKNTEVEVRARVLRRHFAPDNVTLELVHDGRVLTAQRVAFSTGSEAAEAVLSFRPDAKGLLSYTVRAPVYEQETNRRNNSKKFSMEVARDKVRVLYIAGEPGPHYSFLRYQLKSNPSVELVSFVILRDPADVMTFSDNELSLIPFPTQDVLFAQLPSFDLVILEEFSFTNFGITPAGFSTLKNYVEKGGGLLLIGDERMLGPAGPYRGTVMEALLPLTVTGPAGSGGPVRLNVLEPAHPVMSLADDAVASRDTWSRLPSLGPAGVLPGRAAAGAQVLAGVETPAGAGPLLAVWAKGRGRVMALASLSSWRWALGQAGEGQGMWAYQRFWNNVLRWMSASGDFRLVRLDPPAGAVAVGQEVLVRVFARDESYRPLTAGRVTVLARAPDGQTRAVDLKPLGNGDYGETLTFDQAGGHRLLAQAFVRQKKIGQDERVFNVGADWEENRDTSVDFAFLADWAKASGGDFVPLQDFSEAWLKSAAEGTRWMAGRADSFWHSPWVLAGLLLAFFGEWILRRRWGLK